MKTFKNSKKRKFLNAIFRRSRKKKFLNRLKYGQDEKPEYTIEAIVEALVDDEKEKAEEILHKMVEEYAVTGIMKL